MKPACKKCGLNDGVVKNGLNKEKQQTYLCKYCNSRFIPNKKNNRKTKGKKKNKTKNSAFLEFVNLIKQNNNEIPPYKSLNLNISRQTHFRWSKELLNQFPEFSKNDKFSKLKKLEVALRKLNDYQNRLKILG